MITLRRVPDEQIAAAHAAAAVRAPVAPPRVRNASALVALGEPRPLRWRGHHYVVPPLTYRTGARLTIILNVLLENPNSARALVHARRELHRIVRIAGSEDRPGRKPWRNPFAKADGNTLADLLQDLLHIEDESPRPRLAQATKPRTIDLLNPLFEFIRAYPALVGPDGLPISWALYQYGMRYLTPSIARESLRRAQGVRCAMDGGANWKQFESEHRAAAEWN